MTGRMVRWAMVVASLATAAAYAQEASAPPAETPAAEPAPPAEPAPAEPAAADPAAPTPDAVIAELMKIGPDALAARVAELKTAIEEKTKQAQDLRAQADRLDAETKAFAAQLAALDGHVKALSAVLGTPAAADPSMMAAAAPGAEPAPAPAPAPAPEAMEAKVTVNYAEHILPVFKARCATCHNDDKKRGGLSLLSHAGALEGGSSGAVIAAGDPDGSRLVRLVSRLEEPFMPPSGDPLTEEQIDLIREWIRQGAPADAGAKVMTSEAAAETGAVFVAATIPDGPPPMPEVALPPAAAEAPRGVVARAVATNPRSPLMAVGGYRQVLLYNLDDYELLGALPFPEGRIYTLTFSVNGELLLAGGGMEGATGIVVVWNVRKAERSGTYGEGYDTVLAADISPDHTMVAVGGPNRIVRVYSTKDGAELYKIDAHTDWIYSARFSPDGELLATADRAGGLFLWQAANGRPVENLRGHTGAINGLAFSRDSKQLASAGDDGLVMVWDTWKYTKVRQFGAHANGVLSVDYAGNGELVTTGADRLTKRWDGNGKEVAKYEPLPDWGYQARFSADDTLVLAGTWTGEVFVWNTASGERAAALTTQPPKG